MRLLFIAVLLFSLGACSKYEEGSPSLASKRSRLINKWTMVTLTANGYDVTSLKIITGVDIHSNNTFTVYGETNGVQTSSSAVWAFDSNKTHVLVTNGDGTVDSYEIIRLEKDALKLRITNSAGVTFVHEYRTA